MRVCVRADQLRFSVAYLAQLALDDLQEVGFDVLSLVLTDPILKKDVVTVQ